MKTNRLPFGKAWRVILTIITVLTIPLWIVPAMAGLVIYGAIWLFHEVIWGENL